MTRDPDQRHGQAVGGSLTVGPAGGDSNKVQKCVARSGRARRKGADTPDARSGPRLVWWDGGRCVVVSHRWRQGGQVRGEGQLYHYHLVGV
jgi:hypothetical protein